MFAATDWWVTDMPCFTAEKASIVNIQAIDDSSLFSLSKSGFDELLERSPVFEKYFRVLMQKAYVREQLRTIDNLTKTAEERYDKFVEKYPEIHELVPLKHIASYLGITPEFLSMIRSSKAKSSLS